MEIKSRLKDWPADRASVAVNYDMPETLEALVAKFGPEVVAAKAIDSIVIDIQANVRRLIKKEGKDALTQEQIQQKITEYVPSAQARVSRSPQEKIGELVTKLSPEEKKALIKQLREGAAA